MAVTRLERRHSLVFLLLCALAPVVRNGYSARGTFYGYAKEQQQPSDEGRPTSTATTHSSSNEPFISRAEYRLCHECNVGYKGKSNCRDMIYQTPDKNVYYNTTILREQMQTVLKACPQCEPTTCRLTPFRRIRPDDAAPATIFYREYSILPSMVDNNPDKLVVYNPTIVGLPGDMLVSSSAAVYLASFRVTNIGPCGTYNGRSGEINYVGMALLDARLDIVAHTIINPNAPDVWLQSGLHASEKFSDARLFRIHDNMTILSHATNFFPIQVSDTLPKNASFVWPNEFNFTGTRQLHVYIPQRFPPHALSLEPTPTRGSKNFQFFSTSDGRSWVEQWPYPHQLKELHNISVLGGETHVAKQRQPLLPAFEVHDLFDAWNATSSKDRLTACCADLQHSDFGELKVGIAHVKNKNKVEGNNWGYFYLSRFYAFRPTPPFELVALSGLFCLDGPGTSSRLSHPGGLVYNCPAITYISGMTANPNNASQILLAYGVADCSSRIVVMKKDDVLRRLFEKWDEKA